MLRLDKFGYSVGVHYQGSSQYKTLFGSLISVLTYVLIIINALGILSDFINNDNQTEITRKLNVNVPDLGE